MTCDCCLVSVMVKCGECGRVLCDSCVIHVERNGRPVGLCRFCIEGTELCELESFVPKEGSPHE